MCNTSTYFIRPSSHLQRPSQVFSLRSASISNRTCFAPLTSVTASKASSTQQVQRDWHVLPDGTKLEVLTQTCDDVRLVGCDQPQMLAFLSRLAHF